MLSQLLDAHVGADGADWTRQNLALAFARFSETRKVNADAIAQMALENFVEMREKVGDVGFNHRSMAWVSTRFCPLICTYDAPPWGVRVDELTQSKTTHRPEKHYRLFVFFKVGDVKFNFLKSMESILENTFPDQFRSRYAMVCYGECRVHLATFLSFYPVATSVMNYYVGALPFHVLLTNHAMHAMQLFCVQRILIGFSAWDWNWLTLQAVEAGSRTTPRSSSGQCRSSTSSLPPRLLHNGGYFESVCLIAAEL